MELKVEVGPIHRRLNGGKIKIRFGIPRLGKIGAKVIFYPSEVRLDIGVDMGVMSRDFKFDLGGRIVGEDMGGGGVEGSVE